MSFCSVLSAAVIGLRVEFIHVEADVSNGLPVFHMVGYLSSEVKEAAERVRTAIRNSGVSFPAKRTIVNLAPANVRKRGASMRKTWKKVIALSLVAAMAVSAAGCSKSGQTSTEGGSAQTEALYDSVSVYYELSQLCREYAAD